MLDVRLSVDIWSPKVLAIVAAPVLAVAAWKVTGSLLRSYFVGKFTVMKDLPNVGKARPDDERIRGTAVVCGGSIAGLWTARICADHFEDVLIVEPEAWLATEDGIAPVFDENGDRIKLTPEHQRTRLHQVFGAHVFQILTLTVLRHLFPNFDEELLKRNGRIGPMEMNVYSSAGLLYRSPKIMYPNGNVPEMFFCSRDAYERLLRHLVVESSNRIRRMAGTAVGLKTDDMDVTSVKSVTVSPSDGSKTVDISAALVVDCSGGTQAGFKWLKKIHSTLSEQDTESTKLLNWDNLVNSYDIHGRWVSYDFFVPKALRSSLPIPGGYDNCKWLYSFIPFPGRESKNFVIHRLEGHIIRFAFYGWGNPPLPSSAENIREFIATVKCVEPAPQWLLDTIDLLLNEKDNVEVHTAARPPAMNWIHYERASYMPSNFVAIGDAVMRVNPSFGQGCTKACVGAITLDSVLRSSNVAHKREIPKGFGAKFFKVHYNKVVDAWDGTKPMDYMFETTTPAKGERLEDEKVNGTLALTLFDMSITDLELDALLVHVRQFVAPATDVLAPWVLWRLLKFSLKRKLGIIKPFDPSACEHY
ncbi:hypothetical protein SCHPADRAFT_944175 [Schizopora paradoxa]|uniref:FAD/NAD(P)-binding domain-containing protein n=1 Tax=Schizopora paradoxa TaxID=27342 RepID=A0A0H2RBG2_9AGAM|nr:hypothetical protein SCHPADRAFT_944175 [Schizopora paradoxa]